MPKILGAMRVHVYVLNSRQPAPVHHTHVSASCHVAPFLHFASVLLQPARVTVVVRVRPPESGGGGNSAATSGQQHDVVVFPAVGSQNTIVVDRDGAEARCVCVLFLPRRVIFTVVPHTHRNVVQRDTSRERGASTSLHTSHTQGGTKGRATSLIVNCFLHVIPHTMFPKC